MTRQKLTSLDVGQGVHEHEHELANRLEASHSHIENTVVGIIVEGVPVGVVGQLGVRWNLVGQQQSDWLVLTVGGYEVRHETAKLVDHKGAAGHLVEVHGLQFVVTGPFSIPGINVALT